MKKILYLVLILGFLVVDWLMFHDLFKPGEHQNTTQWLTGGLSLVVFWVAFQGLRPAQR